jgi:hypothetical protein
VRTLSDVLRQGISHHARELKDAKAVIDGNLVRQSIFFYNLPSFSKQLWPFCIPEILGISNQGILCFLMCCSLHHNCLTNDIHFVSTFEVECLHMVAVFIKK